MKKIGLKFDRTKKEWEGYLYENYVGKKIGHSKLML